MRKKKEENYLRKNNIQFEDDIVLDSDLTLLNEVDTDHFEHVFHSSNRGEELHPLIRKSFPISKSLFDPIDQTVAKSELRVLTPGYSRLFQDFNKISKHSMSPELFNTHRYGYKTGHSKGKSLGSSIHLRSGHLNHIRGHGRHLRPPTPPFLALRPIHPPTPAPNNPPPIYRYQTEIKQLNGGKSLKMSAPEHYFNNRKKESNKKKFDEKYPHRNIFKRGRSRKNKKRGKSSRAKSAKSKKVSKLSI